MTLVIPPKVPRDFLIGAAKCGTTALAEILAQHPRVFLPPQKEVGFLSNDARYAKGLAWYAARFDKARADQVTLDASVQYLFRPGCAQRLRESVGADHVRSLTVILRHPVERAYSSYWQSLNLGWIGRDTTFEEALAQEPDLLARPDARAGGRTVGAFVGAGLYAQGLGEWRAAFGADKLAIHLTEDLRRDPRDVVDATLRQMGLSWSPDLQAAHRANEASLPRSTLLNTALRGRHPALRHLRAMLPSGVRRDLKGRIDRLNRQPIAYAPIRPDTRAELIRHFLPEIDRLEAILGRDLSAWRV